LFHINPVKNSVTVRVPASSANLGPGFDVHSIALLEPTIEVHLSRAEPGSRKIKIEGAYRDEITGSLDSNAASKALTALSNDLGKPESYAMRIKVNIPPKKGLGLSGAEAVGATVSANHLFKLGLSDHTILRLAARAEPSEHMENVAASLFGGFNIVTWLNRDERPIINVRPPRDLGVAIVVPDIRKASTEAARQLLPSSISKEDYVKSLGRASRISAAFALGDVSAILDTLPWDNVIEPARARGGAYGEGVSAQFLQEEKKLLADRFHVAETVSGAGPSRALWYSINMETKARRKDQNGVIKPAIALVSDRLESLGHKVEKTFITRPSPRGAKIIQGN
jgi:homoserine kinase